MFLEKHASSENPNLKRPREPNPEGTVVCPHTLPNSPHPFDPSPFHSEPLSFSRNAHLRNHFSRPILQWMLANTDASVDAALSTALGTPGPSGTIPTDGSPPPELDDGFTDEDDPTISYRDYRYCLSQRNRDHMVKCRGCHEWSHASCADGSHCRSRADPRFAFWLCPECRSPWLPDAHPRQHSAQEIAEDAAFDDSDNEVLA